MHDDRHSISFGSPGLKWLLKLAGRSDAERAAKPRNPEEWVREGHDHEQIGELARAEEAYRAAIGADPEHAEAHFFLGRLALFDQRNEEAIQLFERAASLQPGEAIYHCALGNALLSMRYFKDAEQAFTLASALQPSYSEAQLNLATSLIHLDRREEARGPLERLRLAYPDLWEAQFNLGGIYREYARIPEAVECYRRCLELVRDHAPARSNLLMIMNYGSEYTAAEIFEEHRRFGEQFARPYVVPQRDRAWPRRLRIGYVSPDLRGHVVTYFLEPLLANHDHESFEIFCYHCHPEKDQTTAQLRRYADHWRDCETWTDLELAGRIREDRVDILVDLAGHTADNRLPVFAMKPAPVQATYLGYPNITGLEAINFHITDAFTDPPAADSLSVERKARLPRTYFCYRPAPKGPGPGPYPRPGAPFTFGCFNNFPKVSPAFVATAARVLQALPDSRLLMKTRPLSVAAVADSLRAQFAAHGIGPDRLDLRGWETGYRDHLCIYHEVDVALDSFPYNGATTSCEALWMGVPVVTLAGDRHAGRMGSSLLNAVDLGDLVAKDTDQFVRICVALASDPQRLEALRRNLRERMMASPLRDEIGFARKMEALYREMWESVVHPGGASPDPVPDEALLDTARRAKAEGRLADADGAVRRVLAAKPDHAAAVSLLCQISFEAAAPGAAVEPLQRAIAANGDVASFHYLLGTVLQEQGNLEDAVASLRRAIELDPSLAKGHNNLGCIYEAVGRVPEAISFFSESVRLEPLLAEAHYNLGNACKQLGDIDRAMRSLEHAVALQPERAEWRSNLAELQYRRWQFDEAITGLRTALVHDPNHRLAHVNLGASLLMTGQVGHAIEALRAAVSLGRHAATESWLLLAGSYLEQDALAQYQAHLAWSERHATPVPRFTGHAHRRRLAPRPHLNIGYVSPDFRKHPVAHFIEPVLRSHDRSRFRVFGYATWSGSDSTTERIRTRCDFWRDLSGITDDQAAERVRADGIDILVDLAGHTAGGRLLVFARKPAPVQMTWIGYPNTTGLAEIDYRITDVIADPPGASDELHSEKLLRLGGGFLTYLPPENAPEPGPSQALADGRITFGSFNTLAKISDEVVALWARILTASSGSRLILKAFGLAAPGAQARLRELFAAHGIRQDRLVLLAPEESEGAHLARYHDIDIALDTFPYNGTTTTCEALWMGVPVVALSGSTHASRVGASLLASAGLPELVASTPDEYAAKALALAEDLGRLRELRSGMRAALRRSPLFDGGRFTKGLEAEYIRLARAAGLSLAF